MFYCFLCKKGSKTVNSLIVHFKLKHNLKSDSKYRCEQANCTKAYHNVYLFKRHLSSKHKLAIFDKDANETSVEMFLDPPTFLDVMSNDSGAACNDNDNMKLLHPALHFLSQLYGMPLITRKLVGQIVDLTTELFNAQYFSDIQNKLLSLIYDSDNNNEAANIINTMFETLRSPFKSLKTEKQRIKYLKELKMFVEPITVTLGREVILKKIKGKRVSISVKLKSHCISLRHTFQKFLTLPNVANLIFDSENILVSDNILSLSNSPLFCKLKAKYLNKVVLPLNIYYDDTEIGNPLGSSAGIHKLGAVYAQIATLPAEYNAKLQNIFLCQLFHSDDLTRFGSEQVFKWLIEELKFLESEGITIHLQGKKMQVYFVLFCVLGDNLGLNTCLGFARSFSSNYFCRFCIECKTNCKFLNFEKKDSLRNIVNYQAHVLEKNYGVREKCVFNTLKSFHVTSNLSVDPMHDLLEGVCRYDMSEIISNLIKCKMFSLKFLNQRIKNFDFEQYNRPPGIKKDHLLSNSIIMSAAEMLALVMFFGALIGDKVTTNCESWSIYLILKEIVDISFCKTVHQRSAIYLSSLINEHNDLFQKIFQKPLKPKFHILTHYPTVMLRVGPLANLSCMRFEARHKPLKQSAALIASRTDISYSLAFRNQLSAGFRFIAQEKLEESNKEGKIIQMDTNALEMYSLPRESFVSFSFLEIKGITIKPLVCTIEVGEEDMLPKFGQVLHLLKGLKDTDLVYVTYKEYITLSYDEHRSVYLVQPTNVHQYIAVKEFYHLMPNVLRHDEEGNIFLVRKFEN